MDLREHTVYLRCTSWRDLLDEGGVVATLIDDLEALTGVPFATSQDLGGRRRRPAAPLPGRVALEALCGLGAHAAGRVRLASDAPGPAQTLTLVAGEHPYTGRFHTALDLRLPRARFEEPGFTERFVRWLEASLVPVFEPFVGHAHDTDDTAMANVHSAAMLRSGFGVEPPPGFDPQTSPGREVNRGELRYLASWLMIVGPALQADLGEEAVAGLASHVERLSEPVPGTLVALLTPSPYPADSALMRARQQAVREQLGFDARARASAYALGFWDQKSRG